MFRGDSALNIDAKGRVAVPARLRERLEGPDANCLVVTVSVSDRCLSAYPLSKWREVELKLLSLPSLNRQAQDLRQALVGSAHEQVFDGQHRILLPPVLREYAGLGKRARVVGQIDRVDIWDEDTWVSKRGAVLDSLHELPLQLDENLRNLVF